MATFTKFDQFVEDKNYGVHDFEVTTGHQLKVALTNTVPEASNDAVLADIIEIAYTNIQDGTTTGRDLTISASGQTAGIFSVTVNDLTLTATGTVPSFQYVVLYNDTPTSPADPLIGWYDYGSTVDLLTGESLTLDFTGALFTDQ